MLDIGELRTALTAVAVAEDAAPMRSYMRDQFDFLGVKAKARRDASKPFVAAAKTADLEEVFAFVDACWAEPEREFQHVACDILRRQARGFAPTRIDDLARYITTESWWDTVDALAAHPVGTMVRTHDELAEQMDVWIDSENMWLARTAILHQLRYKDDTDVERLFAYVDTRAADTEFFIRKALGWALRQYAWVAPDEVRRFVADRNDTLSGLTRREALKNIQPLP